MESKEPEIKSKQASKRDRTLRKAVRGSVQLRLERKGNWISVNGIS
jgi:hypothetical protein